MILKDTVGVGVRFEVVEVDVEPASFMGDVGELFSCVQMEILIDLAS